jgi:hypothetical protein
MLAVVNELTALRIYVNNMWLEKIFSSTFISQRKCDAKERKRNESGVFVW